MQTEKQSWSIIIFCFNEVETIERVAKSCEFILSKIASENYEVLIVDDGSTDGSRAKIESIVNSSQNFRAIYHPENKGIGHTLRTGYFNVKNENVCAVPADGQFDIKELFDFGIVQPNSFISFYRKENTTYTFARNVLSWANRMLNKHVNGFDLKDVNWVKIYKTKALKSLNLELESSLVESEICAKLMLSGFEVKEVTSKYLPREAGMSKGASGKIIKQAMNDTLTLARVLSKFRNAKTVN